MSIPNTLAYLAGEWQAVNRLWLMPGTPVHESKISAVVEKVAMGRFLQIRYTWEEDGPQQGMIVIGQDGEMETVQASWIDSWHNGDRMMILAGSLTAVGSFSVKGSYPAPSGPDWGWRIEVSPGSHHDEWRMTMYNILPDGDFLKSEEMLAVEAVFFRIR
jgi:hypothetical protein